MISCTKHYGHNNDTTQQYKSVLNMYSKKYLTKKNKLWVLLKHEKEALQESSVFLGQLISLCDIPHVNEQNY